jgi:predicted nucleic acid-binding protein
MENNSNTYFSNEELARFVAAHGKIAEKIICHLWQNAINKSDVVEIIDNIQLHFGSGDILTIACNANGDGLSAVDFNAREVAMQLNEEFGGNIKLFKVNASATKMWEDVIGKTLLNIQLTKENDYYKADSLMLNFGEERRSISIGPLDGLVIDFYED